MAATPMISHAYDVRVTYYCELGGFATEAMRIGVSAGDDVWSIVRKAAEESAYFNERIPKLTYSVEFLQPDPTTPFWRGTRAVEPLRPCWYVDIQKG